MSRRFLTGLALSIVCCALTIACSNPNGSSGEPSVGDWRSRIERSGLLPPERLTRWEPGLNAVGGIPADSDRERPASVYVPPDDPYGGFSVDPALANGATDASDAIQAALDAAGEQASERSRKVVYLRAGEYSIRGEGLIVPSYVTLRGQGPRGPEATRLVKPQGTWMPVVRLGHLWVKHTTPVDLAVDTAHGAKRIQVARDPGYQVGELVFIDQLEDRDRVGSWWNPVNQAHPDDDSRGWFSRQNRPTGQVVEIVGIQGNTLELSTPLRLPYFKSNRAQVVRFSGGEQDGPVVPTKKWSGVEDLYVSGGEQGNVIFTAASYSWAKNIESDRSSGSSVAFMSTFRCVLRDSFVHSTVDPNPGGAGYGLDVSEYAADNLVENNISWNFNKVMVMRAAGGGNVIAYNYFEDGWGAGYPTIPEIGMNASHYATSHHELFEGNDSWHIGGDGYWGNAIDVTFFRNHVSGRRRSAQPLQLRDEVMRKFIHVPEWHTGFSFLGNVIGTPDMKAAPQSGFVYEGSPPWNWDPVPIWAIGVEHDAGKEGQDAKVVAATLRHGNFDFFTNGVVWDEGIERRELPTSLYLDRKPSFFGENPWPWVSPEKSGAPLAILPARERFDQLLMGK
ncbi:glycosyl hydrolase family 28-related protein [Vulgatibacter incomptus]|uniref:Endo-1,3-1,4-beta-glucanase n=1 Tax=Vulgatibacter incomptus TaxID=1391653 RepID=A0A0K1P8K3_9BACT|nr:glycosyl hydrolase family 28-related protein [Vulgatibacter incomptus]AKU89850.1 endo-1,3-1,4-beta-glucanase [Vulgatibacter incomptus]